MKILVAACYWTVILSLSFQQPSFPYSSHGISTTPHSPKLHSISNPSSPLIFSARSRFFPSPLPNRNSNLSSGHPISPAPVAKPTNPATSPTRALPPSSSPAPANTKPSSELATTIRSSLFFLSGHLSFPAAKPSPELAITIRPPLLSLTGDQAGEHQIYRSGNLSSQPELITSPSSPLPLQPEPSISPAIISFSGELPTHPLYFQQIQLLSSSHFLVPPYQLHVSQIPSRPKISSSGMNLT